MKTDLLVTDDAPIAVVNKNVTLCPSYGSAYGSRVKATVNLQQLNHETTPGRVVVTMDLSRGPTVSFSFSRAKTAQELSDFFAEIARLLVMNGDQGGLL